MDILVNRKLHLRASSGCHSKMFEKYFLKYFGKLFKKISIATDSLTDILIKTMKNVK